ncbi:ectonucleotide pyrophosphatase/phosphodiesterase family member 5-like [Centruroides vittatus]|uniref:ectonucleotide pyrophosphatase/phosphodiesterase family member 5-like n=1 Tax=Centruroides vittatus TaxID=120091 RepID=UPI0035101DB4
MDRIWMLLPLLFSAFTICLCASIDDKNADKKVLLISFDGFRWDYYKTFNTPNLDYLARTGIHAPKGVQAVFTTKTFPNHYSIATGLYEESHGIVDNNMYDVVFNETFKMKKPDPKWWGGEPIWVTARKQGLKSGAYFWPASDIPIKDTFPNYYFKYNNTVSMEARIETAVHWLATDQVNVALVYFNEPDKTGHRTGAMSDAVGKMVETVDKLVGFLLEKLLETFLLDRVNLIIMSDHGMVNLTDVIVLEKYLRVQEEIKWLPLSGPVSGILPHEGKLDRVYNTLKNAHPNMTVYKKENIPERWHYKNHRRIMPIIAVADQGYLIAKEYGTDNAFGQHGYDNILPSMRPIFFARGPAFKENYQTDVFETVNVYPLICHLLGIKPAPNNGTLDSVRHLLKN